MKQHASPIVRPSLLAILLLLVALSLAAAPVAAQDRTTKRGPDCVSDASVMGWDETAPSGTTFTMTKDCDMFDTVNREVFLIRNGKTFTIDGAGFTIYANDYPDFNINTRGTVVGFRDGSDSQLTLINVTIEGGGGASQPVGGDPDPAIIVQNGTLILDAVTIQNTRGGAIRVIGDNGKVYVKNSTFNGNQLTGLPAFGDRAIGSVISIHKGEVFLQNLLTMKNNTGAGGAIRIYGDGNLDVYDLSCLDIEGNVDADGSDAATYHTPPSTQEWRVLWRGKPRKGSTNCDANTASTTPRPAPPMPAGAGVDIQMEIAKGDGNYEGRLSGMIGSQSAYYLTRRSGGVVTLQIYRVDGSSVGHWVMDVSQAAVDALGGAGCVASSPDGRYAVRVWADGNVTVSDGPDHENKVFHNTLQGGLSNLIIATETTYSSTPPGMGCPGYMG